MYDRTDAWLEDASTVEGERQAREELAEDDENARTAVWSGAPSYYARAISVR